VKNEDYEDRATQANRKTGLLFSEQVWCRYQMRSVK